MQHLWTVYCFIEIKFVFFYQIVESYSYEGRFENSSGIHSGSDTVLEKVQLETISTSSSNEPQSDSSNSVSLTEQPMSLTVRTNISNFRIFLRAKNVRFF